MVETLRDFLRAAHKPESLDAVVAEILARRGELQRLPAGVSDAAPVRAFINANRWIARCPYCVGAERVDPDDPRFFCLSCHNAGAGGLWLRVEFPARRAEIEAALDARPVRNRHWDIDEPLIELLGQNLDHGIGGR